MKMKNAIIKAIGIAMAVVLGMGTISSFATEGSKNLQLSKVRYVYSNGSYVEKHGYALQTTNNHPVYQISSIENGTTRTGTNYYCLNAEAGDSWTTGSVTNPVEYNTYYDLDSTSDLELLGNESNTVYKNIAESDYLNQILWILGNMYVPDNSKSAADNLNEKRALLAKAGIVFGEQEVGEELDGTPIKENTYKYVAQSGYNYSSRVSSGGRVGGWNYTKNDVFHYVEVPDELVEVAQQMALWYYTNYMDNSQDSKYDIKAVNSGATDRDLYTFLKIMVGNDYKSPSKENGFESVYDNSGSETTVEAMQNEQAAILAFYLIDAAQNYAENTTDTTGNPLTIAPSTNAPINTKSGFNVIGPITISKTSETVYDLEDTIYINGTANSNAYISDANGNRQTGKTVSDYVGNTNGFYVAVPTSIGSDVTINFKGTYKNNGKKLWIKNGATEQPIVEVTPNNPDLTLTVKTAQLELEFDLALRKAITKLTNASGAEKYIYNEKSQLAKRNVNYVATDINNNETATYKHRKDPVVVENGDIVTYSITVYNEGGMNGYAKEITDKLPAGLTIYGENEGTYTSGSVSYSYKYTPSTNTIIFTNVSNNVLEAYNGGNSLSSETIEVKCKVQQEQSNTNTYLTNLAYISKEYNSETGQDVTEDRDSSTSNNPSTSQVTTGDKYTGYHGGNNNNGNNTKDVYKDGTNNDDYFPGREDDDDFEVIVIKPAEFDLALQKYISNITTNGTTRVGRSAPTINTRQLAEKSAYTATYTQDKKPIKVKSGDYITYTFTVYNEGEVNGYVNKITDNIPEGLEYVYQDTTKTSTKELIAVDYQGNTTSGITVDDATYELVRKNSYWSVDNNNSVLTKNNYNGKENISITCDVTKYLENNNTNKLLNAYNKSNDTNYDGSGLDRVSVTVVFRVSSKDGSGATIRNEAAITEATDASGVQQDTGDLRDRDSQINNWPGKDSWNGKETTYNRELGDTKYQDDEDFDNIILDKVDLALTKFIVGISKDMEFTDGEYLTKDTTANNAGTKANPYTRQTAVNTTQLRDNPACHDATYIQVKTPLTVASESYVLYNIRVYNEGDIDVYAGEIKDHLPNYLDYIDCKFNQDRGWNLADDKKTVTSKYLAYKQGETTNLLRAFNKNGTDDGEGSELDYRDIQILCQVNSEAPNKTELVNTAEISEYQDENGNTENYQQDIDSHSDNRQNKNDKSREQDDDDYEVVLVKQPKVDIALSKFIAAISDDPTIEDGEYLTSNKNVGSKDNPYTRATKVDTRELRDNPDCHDATYTKVKDPLTVPAQSYVLYDIRVYNEGDVDLYAGEVTDYLPEYLDYVECEWNNNFNWNVASDGKTISTKYLAYKQGETTNLLKAFNKTGTDDGAGSELDYRDLQIVCRVNDKAPTGKNLVNVAEITKYEDENGNEIPKDTDVDSNPKNKDEKHEDDDDYEVVLIKTFDLSLLKYVSTVYVTEDGKTTTTQTGNTGDDNTDIIPKVEIHRKKLNSTVVKFGYTIKITNEGDIAGYAKEITDYVPEGLKFYAEDNNGWTDEGNNVIKTKLLADTLLQPGESAEVTVIFRWINENENLGLKTNTAEISEDYNEEGVPDRDSTPGNKTPGEDDIDDAQVLLSISTGLIGHIIMYTAAGAIILMIFAGGIIAIKKYVL